MRKSRALSAYVRILFGSLFLLIAVSIGLSAGDSAREILEKVQKKYDEMFNATLSFSQKVKFGLSKAEYSASGMLYMKKSNHYRIEMEDRTFVTDGKTVWSYSPENKQVLIDTYKEDPRSFSPEKFLLSVPKDFYSAILAREKSRGQTLVVLKLTPKDDKSSMKSLKLWVDEEEWLLRKAEIVDVNKNVRIYTVLDIRLNTTLSDSTFAFVAPPGVEVVDLR